MCSAILSGDDLTPSTTTTRWCCEVYNFINKVFNERSINLLEDTTLTVSYKPKARSRRHGKQAFNSSLKYIDDSGKNNLQKSF